MKHLAALALLLASCASTADTIGLHLASRHFPARGWLNDQNTGLYYRADNGFTAGVYRNSLDRDSVYAGWTYSYEPFSVTVGVVTGYQLQHGRGYKNGVLTPMLAPSVALPRVLGVTPRITIIPGTGRMSTVLHLSVERSF